MQHTNKIIMIFAAIAAASTGYAAQSVTLRLSDAVAMAVQKNPDLVVRKKDIGIAEAEVGRNRGIYDPKLNLSSGYDGGSNAGVQTGLNASAGVAQLLPTGATVGVDLKNSYQTVGTRDLTGGLQGYIAQPLMKGFGREYTELNIAIAASAREATKARYATQVLATVAQVRTEYYRLYAQRQELESKKLSLQVAQKVLDETKAKVKAGVLPAMEISNAEYGVASREKEMVDAERAVRDEEGTIRLLLNLRGTGEIIPADVPPREPLKETLEEAIRIALERRTDLQELVQNLRTADLQVSGSENRLRPDLSLRANAGVGTAGPYSGSVATSAFDKPSWGVGVQFSMPIGNTAAKNELIQNRLKKDQAEDQIAAMKDTIENQVETSRRAVDVAWKQLEVTARARKYAEERLQAMAKKHEVGLATTKDVLDVENDLSAARTGEISAHTAYGNAITQLWKDTGELLARENITIS